MQFTTIYFAVFFIIVFTVYWFVLRKSVQAQNSLLLVASYAFYAWWDWRFLGLIVFTSIVTFFTAKHANGSIGKYLTAASITVNLGILFAFKYFGFFADSFGLLLASLGIGVNRVVTDIALPVGISFYTFQCIAYSVDVYRKKVAPCSCLLTFCLFVAYFPQLVAGPIERASQLLPQLTSKRNWRDDYAASGLRMVLFGVMKKVCVADMLAPLCQCAFDDVGNPLIAVKGGIYFSLQIYLDFSAYSEIARGTSRLLGIELMANFRFPYFSRNIVEFWSRWHISLMWWFRDYVYIPLGGSRKGSYRTAFNIVAVFVLSGLWHGAAWNFVAWGVFWAVAYVVGKMLVKMAKPDGPIEFGHLPQMIATMWVVAFGFYIFRCNDFQHLLLGAKSVGHYTAFFGVLWLAAKLMVFVRARWRRLFTVLAAMCCLAAAALVVSKWQSMLYFWWVAVLLLVVAMEWKNRNCDYAVQHISRHRWVRWAFYWICIASIILSEPLDMGFIYFQF